MTNQKALHWGTETLKYSSVTAYLDAMVLLCHVLNLSKAALITSFQEAIKKDDFATYETLILKRQTGYPVAYLLGYKEFWSCEFKVNEHTLIPRPETELLVSLGLKLLPENPPLRVLELGTGSGAIALSLATERPNWNIDAIDISEEALKVAEQNQVQLKPKLSSTVRFAHSDWFSAVEGPYDAILSNPPYISEKDPHLLEDIRYEPIQALVSGVDGLKDLAHIIEKGYSALAPGGLLLVEHGATQETFLKKFFNSNHYQQVKTWKDDSGVNRVTGGYRGI